MPDELYGLPLCCFLPVFFKMSLYVHHVGKKVKWVKRHENDYMMTFTFSCEFKGGQTLHGKLLKLVESTNPGLSNNGIKPLPDVVLD